MIPNEREGALYTFLCEKRRAASLQARPGGIRDSLRREASQAAGAAPTLRYGPAGDSAPRLRLKAFWYGRRHRITRQKSGAPEREAWPRAEGRGRRSRLALPHRGHAVVSRAGGCSGLRGVGGSCGLLCCL